MDKGETFDSEYEDKLCFLSTSEDQDDLDRLNHLEKDGRYVCSACGRTAASEENLCAPEEIST
jgi:hypothetical protein